MVVNIVVVVIVVVADVFAAAVDIGYTVAAGSQEIVAAVAVVVGCCPVWH